LLQMPAVAQDSFGQIPSATASRDGPCARCPGTSARPGRRNGLTARTKKLRRQGARNDVVPQPVSRRGLREDETRWRIGLPGACEHW
jgi:hypothetical protein